MKTVEFSFSSLVCVVMCVSLARAADQSYFWNKTTSEEQVVDFWPSQPSGAGVTYADPPFTLSYLTSNGHFLNLVGSSGVPASGSWNQHAMTEIRDCNVRVSCMNKSFRVDFDSGKYNWFDPFGETWKTLPYIEWMRCAGCWQSCDTVGMYVHGGETRWPRIWVRGWSQKDTYFTFDGGTHLLGGEVQFPYDTPSTGAAYHFEVTNTAKVVLGAGFRMGLGASEDQDLFFKVADGGELKIEGAHAHFKQQGKGRHKISVENAAVTFGPFDSATECPLFSVGPQTASDAAEIKSIFFMTNAVVSDGTIKFYGGDNRIVDTEMPGTKIHIGCTTGLKAAVSICNVKIGDTCNVGANGSATLIVEGTANVVTNLIVGGKEGWNQKVAEAALAFAEGAELTCRELLVGGRYGTKGVIEVPTGSRMTVDESFCIGKDGVGELLVSGGDFKAPYGFMGQSDTSATPQTGVTNVLRMTGGAVTLTYKADDSMGLNVCDNPHGRPCKVVLDGGMLTARSIRGWRGTPSYRFGDSTGWASFEADGGTLVALCATTRLLDTFETAALGAKGLMIRSDYNVTVAQNFTNKQGAVGKLVLAGAGVKTLSGMASTESELVVSEGKVVFTDSARHASDVAVSGGATLELAGAADSGMLTGLMLGDDMKAATLVLSDRPVVVNGDLVIKTLEIDRATAFAYGTTTVVFRVTGNVSAASLGAWEETRLVADTPVGAAVDFIHEMESGVTVLKVVVRNGKPVDLYLGSGKLNDVGDYAFPAADALRATVADGAALTLSGRLAKGSLEKHGKGVLTLLGTGNRFLGGVFLYDGLLRTTSLSCLGYDMKGSGLLTLAGGTLELSDAASPAELGYALAINTGSAESGCVIKTDSDIVIRTVVPTTGALFKRGRGTLSFEAERAMNLVTGNGTLNAQETLSRPETGIVFDEQGSVPSPKWQYGGLNVVEGSLILRGIGAEPAAFALTESVCVGLPSLTRTEGAGEPTLVIDHANVTMNAGSRPSLYLGGAASAANSAFVTPALVLTNGATLTMHQMYVNMKSDPQSSQKPTCVIDGSTLSLVASLCANTSGRGVSMPKYILRNGARLYAAVIDCYNASAWSGTWNGPIEFTANASLIAKNAQGEPLVFEAGNESSVLTFEHGTRFCCNSIARGGSLADGSNVLTFDDAEWYPGAVDFVFDAATAASVNTKCIARGKGLVLSPPKDCTYTWARTLEGSGGFVKRGEGTLIMSMANCQATGTIVLEAGRLELPDGAVTNVIALGAGTLARTTVGRTKITYAIEDGKPVAVPTFDDVTFKRTVYFDFGDAVLPEAAFAFATYTGTAPDVSKWRTDHYDATGRKLAFTAADGVVTATPQGRQGLLFIVR